MQKKIEKISFDFEIIAFELVLLKTRFYWERILVIGCQHVKKSVKIIDATKTEVLKVIFFHSYIKIEQKDCRVELSSVFDPLTCWLSISVLGRRFLGI